MKKTLLIILFAGLAPFLWAQSEKPQTPTDLRKWALEGGISGIVQSEQSFLGFALGLGYYVTPHHRLSYDMGVYFHREKIGWFSYTLNGSSTVHTDGKIYRNYTLTPIMLTWNYEFNLSKNVHLRTGASIGNTHLNASTSFSPSNIDGLPESPSASDNAFTYALNLNLMRDVFKQSSISLGYRFLGNSGTTLEMVELEPAAHQLNLTFCWRFSVKK